MPQQPMKRTTMPSDVKLFTMHGMPVTTIALPLGEAPDVVIWQGRYFVRQFGAYREAAAFVSNEAQR
jgi:hypothetical protein